MRRGAKIVECVRGGFLPEAEETAVCAAPCCHPRYCPFFRFGCTCTGRLSQLFLFYNSFCARRFVFHCETGPMEEFKILASAPGPVDAWRPSEDWGAAAANALDFAGGRTLDPSHFLISGFKGWPRIRVPRLRRRNRMIISPAKEAPALAAEEVDRLTQSGKISWCT